MEFLFGRDTVERRAKGFKVIPATLYRWLQRYNAYGTVTDGAHSQKAQKAITAVLRRRAERGSIPPAT